MTFLLKAPESSIAAKPIPLFACSEADKAGTDVLLVPLLLTGADEILKVPPCLAGAASFILDPLLSIGVILDLAVDEDTTPLFVPQPLRRMIMSAHNK